MQVQLDKFDLMILTELQRDCSISTSELADRVGLSQSPCWRRIQRLKDDGFIKRNVAVLDKSKLGHLNYIYAFLRMATLKDHERDEFIRHIESTPEILECHTVFGDMDILLKVIAPSVEWYQTFVFKKLSQLPGVLNVQSTITLQEIKFTTELPVQRIINLTNTNQ
ncbi:AsnC family transcriptional regulator [Pseudidiomarina salinarum]|uniref:AsnC family transcriptional regulator n=1 Tax=Pseudidiomarina salinarum TaxID=435908 RepID=A0A094JDL0_9GAMM|nr:Lrp/AsnC family transcriptional regulator [Pseudidiomarina salinarum]KFZ30651.1 AsnC family transcriptional regulator [Pseudidiomarina salinarum]RUO69166.1 Lrp/AsnC family transcriptional regulator [Pseudidiomarina salinarum]